MWDIGKAEPTDGGSSRVPELKVVKPDGGKHFVSSNEEKGKVFERVFFSAPPAILQVPVDAIYPQLTWVFKPPMDQMHFSHLLEDT